MQTLAYVQLLFGLDTHAHIGEHTQIDFHHI